MRVARPARRRLVRVNRFLVQAAFVTQKHRPKRVILAFYPIGTSLVVLELFFLEEGRRRQTLTTSVVEAVMRKAGAGDGPPNPVCGVLARVAFSTQRAWGATVR
jgi:hypothetical protein